MFGRSWVNPMPNLTLRPIAYGTGLTLSTDGKMRIEPIRNALTRWSISGTAYCLNRKGQWEHEPIPSDRDEAFYSRCRYASLDETAEFLRRHLEGQNG